jgi:ferredoxin--NADP+ reductase
LFSTPNALAILSTFSERHGNPTIRFFILMSTLGSSDQPLRVAIIGSGPSGFYAAEALFKSDASVRVDMFDHLPSPYGLVRLGVAPDHPKIKTSIRVYEKIAAHEDYAFWGNVTVGQDVTLPELQRHYDAVLFASGAATDRRLDIPGEDLPGSYTATEFVAWYNGHPDYRDHEFGLSAKTAIVVGQGNVAMDVCRILAKTVDELKSTDIAQHALDALAESSVEDIYMIGRRGPVQAKFSQKEAKEMGKLEICEPIVTPSDLELDPLSQAEYDDSGNQNAQRVLPVLREFSERPSANAQRRLHFEFLKSPVEIIGNGKVESIRIEKNRLEGEPNRLKARGTGETIELSAGLIFRSVGYRGAPIPGVPFRDDWGVIPNDDGRVTEADKAVPGLYVAGWIKRGPTGVIGTNKPDAQATVAALLDDLASLKPCESRDSEPLQATLKERGVRVVSFADWKIVDAAEIERGKAVGKPREKFVRVDEVLALLDK